MTARQPQPQGEQPQPPAGQPEGAQHDADVLVLGAGPVGLVTALMLAEKGWSVHLAERWPTPYKRPRAVTLDAEAVRTIQRMGLVDRLQGIGTLTRWYDWRNAEGKTLLLFDRSQLAPPGWQLVIFSQPDLEDFLEEEAQANPLITITRGVEAVDIRETPEQVELVLRHTEVRPDGSAVPGTDAGTLRGRFLVGADGANSLVRRHLGTEMEDLGFFYDWLIVDIIPTVERDWGDSSIQICSPQRPTTVVPGGRGRRRWEFMVMPGEDPATIGQPEKVWELLEPWQLDESNAIIERSAVYTFQARWARNWYRGRVAIAGDSAHQMPPFAGQGLCSGIRDAANLSWKLDLALSGAAPFSLLDSYTAERAEHIQYAIRFSVELGKVICVLDEEEARKRDERMLQHRGDPSLALPQLPAAAFTRGIVDAGPDNVAVPPAGTLVPQYFVSAHAGDEPIRFDDVVGTGALLVTRAAAEGLSDEVRDQLARVGGRIVQITAPGQDEGPASALIDRSVIDANGSYAAEFDRLGAVAYLARPDGYYFGAVAQAGQIGRLVADFVAEVTSPAAVMPGTR